MHAVLYTVYTCDRTAPTIERFIAVNRDKRITVSSLELFKIIYAIKFAANIFKVPLE